MDIDEILSDLQNAIQTMEDEKVTLTELQEDMRQFMSQVQAWFTVHGEELPEVK